jgi:hypothetical protein
MPGKQTSTIYMYQEKSVVLRDRITPFKFNRYNQTNLYPRLNNYELKNAINFKE